MKHPIEDTIRVLFIEDDPAVAEMYKLKLELDGYQVKVVSNDDQVMQEAAALRPDMIFLDLRMGEELGIATLQRLRATDGTRHLPVIILSSSDDPRDIRRAYDSGANSYLCKPHSSEGLGELLKALQDYWLKFNHFPPCE